MSNKTIRGRIIRILDNQTVIINLGKNDGVTDNTLFEVLGRPEDVVDPFEKKTLGRVMIVKAKVKAAGVYEMFTIASSKWYEVSVKMGSYPSFEQLFASHDAGSDKLQVRPQDVKPWASLSLEPVTVGDVVEAIVVDKPPKESADTQAGKKDASTPEKKTAQDDSTPKTENPKKQE